MVRDGDPIASGVMVVAPLVGTVLRFGDADADASMLALILAKAALAAAAAVATTEVEVDVRAEVEVNSREEVVTWISITSHTSMYQ